MVIKKLNYKTKKHTKKIKNSDYGIIGLFKENKGLLNIAEDLKNDFIQCFPKEKNEHFFGHTYSYKLKTFLSFLSFYKDLYDFLDIQPNFTDGLIRIYHLISNPELNRTPDQFKKNFERLKKELTHTDHQIFHKLQLISKKECFRLFESMKSLNTDCNYAAVVMSVSATENRLHKLLRDANSKLYREEFERTTLGGIIELFRRDTRYKDRKYDKFKKILPDKHKPLIEILNTYRIFSAHPKEEKISNQTAKAIVSFSFLLLTDTSLKSKKLEP